MWTALPRHADASHLHLDVFVSPRLGLNAPVGAPPFELADFPELAHWTRTLDDRITFEVELDGTRLAADVVSEGLDHDAWDHLFPNTTSVRPWSFRNLSERPIYSFPLRFVTAYLRDLYRDVGRKHPTSPPASGDLTGMVEDLGPLTDVHVPDERRPPPRDPGNLPLPVEPTPKPPKPPPKGCLGGVLGTLWRLFVAWLRKLLGLPPSSPPPTPPPDPTPPKVPPPHVVHPSPYEPARPLTPVTPPAIAALDELMDANKVIDRTPPHGDMAEALGHRDITFDFARAKRFFERPESEAAPTAPPELPELDFHQAVAALGDYPTLLRALGLVVRLRCVRPATDPESIRVVPRLDGAIRPTDVAPRTRCSVDGDRFAAAPRPPSANRPPSELAGGTLDLTGADDRLATDLPQFDIVQVDSDGAALKAMLAAATIERRRQLETENVLGIDLPDEQATPSLRSGGLAIVRPDRAWYVRDRLLAASGLKDPKPAPAAGEPALLADELFADDLLRGYRVEIEHEGDVWRSLCSRTGTYRLVDATGGLVRQLPTVTDEGYVKSTSASSAPGDGKPLYVHEVIARWTGWSLTVPRPGRTMEPHLAETAPPDGHYEQVDWPKSEASPGLRLEVAFSPVPGSLPRLRFGRTYRMRVRAIDLAGGLLAGPAASDAASDPVTYRRFEPAGPPAALALREFWPGESLERIVVRSDFDRDSDSYAQQVMGAAASEAAAQRTRHLFPPKTAQQMAELHGRLEVGFGGDGDPDAAYRISLRESGNFTEQFIYDVATVDVDQPVATIPFGTPVPINPGQKGEYWINSDDETLLTPYLPDPLAAGVVLRGVPGLVDHVDGDPLTVVEVPKGATGGETEIVLVVPWSGAWPHHPSLRLRVDEQAAAPQAPHWDGAARVLTIHLAKGAQKEVRYSSFVTADGLDDHGVWSWIEDPDDPAATATLRAQAEHGAHWMISPPRVLALVHAVQRPLRTPHFPTLDPPPRTLGETTAELNGKLALDVASTGRMDVVGRWTEWLDDPIDGVVKEPREAVAFDLNVPAAWDDELDFPPAGDGLRARHEFADTRHRRVAYSIVATTRFREYLPDGLTVAQLTRESAATEIAHVNVKSSARPDAPRVLYAVPTFDWPSPDPAPNWTTIEHKRGGGGLRIYVDRPWYSSGEGELLGVVMMPQSDASDGLRSRLGRDPTSESAAPVVTVSLEPKHFPNRVVAADKTGLSPAEDETLTATVAGFEPAWDAVRKLWYFDVQFALPGWNYWPFVRLALCRYQPDSIEGAHVSQLVVGEFAQLAPDRHLSLSWIDPTHLSAVLRGPAPTRSRDLRIAFRVQTTSVPAGTDADELDWEHAAGTDPDVDSQAFSNLLRCEDPDEDGFVTWQAVVELPHPRHFRRMRLEVAEYEPFDSDEEIGGGLVARVTYAAHVRLD